MALHSGKATCKETFYLAELCTLGRFTLPCCPGCRCSTALKSANVSVKEKVHRVLRGAVRSFSNWLAVHCIATPVLPLQRIFPQTMSPKQDRKLHLGLRQGQATRLSARRPAQRPARHRGWHTGAPNALKTGHCKQTFTDFKVLPAQYDKKKRIGASAKARRRAFRRAARPSVRQGIGGGTLPPPMH